jgi:hypothetical protein
MNETGYLSPAAPGQYSGRRGTRVEPRPLWAFGLQCRSWLDLTFKLRVGVATETLRNQNLRDGRVSNRGFMQRDECSNLTGRDRVYTVE